MTSASELFHNRRSRIGRNDLELGFGSSSSSSLDRTVTSPVPGHHNHNHDRRRSRHHHHRREIEEIDQIRRSSSNSRHFCHREHETIRFDHGANQVSTRNSSGSSSSRANRMQFSRSDQLPGDVLLARERLVERLRGVSISSNRHGNRLTSGVPWDEFTYNDDFWETEPPPSDWFRDIPPNISPQRPRGLNQEELNHLHREIYNDKLLLKVGLVECTICLDYFRHGDDVLFLPCNHTFHSVCLLPWIQTCGDCPNCRAGVLDSKSPQD